MAGIRSEFAEYLVSTEGAPLSNCSVTVYKANTPAQELATIYINKTGTVKVNPFENETDGLAAFCADPGMYTIVITDLRSPQRFTQRTINWSAVSGAEGGIPTVQLETGQVGNVKIAGFALGSEQSGELEGEAYSQVLSGKLSSTAITAAKLKRFPGCYASAAQGYYYNPTEVNKPIESWSSIYNVGCSIAANSICLKSAGVYLIYYDCTSALEPISGEYKAEEGIRLIDKQTEAGKGPVGIRLEGQRLVGTSSGTQEGFSTPPNRHIFGTSVLSATEVAEGFERILQPEYYWIKSGSGTANVYLPKSARLIVQMVRKL